MGLLLNDSTAMHIDEIIDCRYLILSLEFHDLEEAKAQSFVLEVLEWINSQIDNNFVSSWKIDGRSVGAKNLGGKARETLQEHDMCFFSMEAYWKNEKISTKQQLRQWRRFIQWESYNMGWPPRDWSVDFADYWNNHILPHAKDKVALKQAILQLFREKNRHAIGVCRTSDVEASISLQSQEDAQHLRRGKIRICASAFALAKYLPETAEMWKTMLIAFAQKYNSLNGRVMLQPYGLGNQSPYMTYFENGKKLPPWYLPGVEWANVLSPDVQEELEWDESDSPHEDTIECVHLPGGCMLFASRRSILEYDIEDALLLKSWLKEVLCPGPGIGYPFSMIMHPVSQQGELTRMPRKNWAIVPILEEEIQILGPVLYFNSNFI